MGCKNSSKDGNEAAKSDDVKGTALSGVRASFVMVMGSAKSDESAVNSLKASCNSEDAIRPSDPVLSSGLLFTCYPGLHCDGGGLLINESALFVGIQSNRTLMLARYGGALIYYLIFASIQSRYANLCISRGQSAEKHSH